MFLTHVIGLFWENKLMPEFKNMYESLNLIGSLTVAVSFPWIAFKLMKMLWTKKALKELVGKVVVITGASSGLGEALAHEFYKRGCQVVLCARRKDELDRVRNDLLHTHSVNIQTHTPIVMPFDLGDITTLPNHVDKILSITGHIDILINNGGLSYRGRVIDTDMDVHMKVMMVNYFGSVALTKAILPEMVKRRQGHIVFVSSIQGLIALPERSAYSASKHAMQSFADALRSEVADCNVRVSIVSPGYIKTQLSVNALTNSGQKYAKMDETTEKGYKPETVASQVVKAVVERKKEMIVATLLPRMAVFLRHFLPSLYFFIMVRRFRKENVLIKQ